MDTKWKIRICKYLTMALLVTSLAVVTKRSASAENPGWEACVRVVQDNCLEMYPGGPGTMEYEYCKAYGTQQCGLLFPD